ncbi:MAG TPA: HAMP domain-containing sensor histidine kinase [Mycobacteriales bacterium]|nr:HAMP domain-containing sensor histidine kinase [Mycobacteriales bacterium]
MLRRTDEVADPVTVLRYDELPDGVLVAGPDGSVEVLNRAGARLLGVDRAEVAGRDFRAVIPLVDLSGMDWWQCADPYRGLPSRTGQPERLLELAAGPRRGRQLLVTARYVRDQGRLVRLVVAFRGTAARERAERDRADLVSTVAHEIRSPLTGVKGFTATLLAKWDRFTDEQKRVMLSAVNADADRVTRLLSELLDVSRIDAGRIVLRRQVVDLPALIERVVASRVASGQRRDRFVVSVAEPLPELWLDPDKIAQITGNLVENALLHGGGTVTLGARPARSGDGAAGVEITVTDEGGGVPPDIRPRIFSRFWRGGNGGTGLGLYIVRGLVAAHGGAVEVGEGPTGGASFRVLLPAGRPPYETPAPPAPPPAPRPRA